MLGGQGRRAVVHHLPHPGEQVFTRLGDRTADHDHRRVEQVDGLGEHLPEAASGEADEPVRLRVAGLDEGDDVGDPVDVVAERGELPHDGAAPAVKADAFGRLELWKMKSLYGVVRASLLVAATGVGLAGSLTSKASAPPLPVCQPSSPSKSQ